MLVLSFDRCYDHDGRDRDRRLPMITAGIRGCLRQAVAYCLPQPFMAAVITAASNWWDQP